MDVSFLKWDSLFWRSLGGGGEREREEKVIPAHTQERWKEKVFV